jgi:arabinofuranan 3-O-arabinosyltransferase
MTGYLNALEEKGSVLVLPPDDFYQMPYTWGYYGNDGFIVNMISRPVIVPNEQGYLTTQAELVSAVAGATHALADGDWEALQSIMRALGSQFVLVRQDIDSSFPNRQIVSPTMLSEALKAAPNFVLLRRAGPLELYRLRAPIPAQLEVTTRIATVDSTVPDLRVLKYFPPDTVLISGQPRPGRPAIQQLPNVSSWDEVDARLTYTVTEAPGWKYRVVPLEQGSSLRGSAAGAALPALPNVGIKESPLAPGKVQLSIQGKPILTNGDFKEGIWNPVGDCYDIGGTGALANLGALVVPDASPTRGPALRLSASEDSACEVQWLKWNGGPLRISMLIHHVSGAAPRLCLWQVEIRRCATIAPIADRSGWIDYRTFVTPDESVKTLGLFLYSDATPSGPPTVNEYARVTAVELSGPSAFAVIGQPDKEGIPEPMAVLRTTFSSYWRASNGAPHVVVDGILNGWPLSQGQGAFVVNYLATPSVRLSQLVSAAGALAVVGALVGYTIRSRLRRWRHAKHHSAEVGLVS